MIIDVPVMSPKEWNRQMDLLGERLPVRCVDVSNEWAHPWSVLTRWMPKNATDSREEQALLGEWQFKVTPGFINGIDPEFDTLARLAPATVERIYRIDGEKVESGDTVAAYLTEAPVMNVGSTRMIGEGASVTGVKVDGDNIRLDYEPIPEFFKRLGVSGADSLELSLRNGDVTETPQPGTLPTEERRLLHAFDIVLRIDRLAAKVDVTRGTAALDAFNYLIDIRYGRDSVARERPYLIQTAQHVPLSVYVDDLGLLDGIADPEYDELRIATVYLLSPQGYPVTAKPNGQWTTHVAHNVFWNLGHAPQTIPSATPFKPISVRTGLIAGIGDSVGNQILSTLNDETNAALQLMRSRRLTGTFWTV